MSDLNALSLDALWNRLAGDGLVRRLLEIARDEDVGPAGGIGDITSRVSVGAADQCTGRLVFRQAGVVAGLRAIPLLAEVMGVAARTEIRILAPDGGRLNAGGVAAEVRGPARDVLLVERTMLNLVARLSGIATRTAAFVSLVEGTGAGVYDTRKTTPGLRNLEKYAVRCGGGRSHRLGLFDAVLIKDNHLATAPVEGIASVVAAASARAREIAAGYRRELAFVECEVDSLDQFRAILASGGCGLDVVLLDNMSTAQLAEAVRMRDASGVRVQLEASGGVHERTIRAIAETGVERISVGGLTHQATSLDVGLDFD